MFSYKTPTHYYHKLFFHSKKSCVLRGLIVTKLIHKSFDDCIYNVYIVFISNNNTN